MGLLATILEILISRRVQRRFEPYEIRSSLIQVAQRWTLIISEDEKKKISRTLGGNRYAKTTYAMLDSMFEEILDEHRNTSD